MEGADEHMLSRAAEQRSHEQDPWAAQPKPATTAGPLVAVCALCGGAGASTLAYLTARSAVEAEPGPVLVCDTGGPQSGLAAYARVESLKSLSAAANAIAARQHLGMGLFADAGGGLRVMASRPELGTETDEAGLARLLADARAAHRLTVVDCGVVRGDAEQQVVEAVSHVIWVLPATLSGLRRGARTLELFGVDAGRQELVVARSDPAGQRPPMDALGALAESRSAPLVLMPHVPDLAERPAQEALIDAGLSLDAIRAAIRR